MPVTRRASYPGCGWRPTTAPAPGSSCANSGASATRARSSRPRCRCSRTRGYAAVTVEDIAGEAGISERTFFRYFASKDHLLVAEAGRRIDVIHESLTAPGRRARRVAGAAQRGARPVGSEDQVGRNAAIWAHLTKEAPALLAKMIMHGALEGTHNIEVELARRLGVPDDRRACPT